MGAYSDNQQMKWKTKITSKLQKLLLSSIITLLFVGTTTVYANASNFQHEFARVVVVYKNNLGKQKLLSKAVEIHHQFHSLNAFTVTLTERNIEEIENDPNIQYVERNHNLKPLAASSIPVEEKQWNFQAIHAAEAWAQGYTGKGVKVAVLDSGIADHSELTVAGKVSMLEDDPITEENEALPTDNNGHGTHVAGIIGAKYNQKYTVGVAPGVSLYSVKVTDNSVGSVLDLVEGIDWAIQNDMDIINISLGTAVDVKLLRDAVDRAYNAGIVIVAAAGNDGPDHPIGYPANYDSAIAVSAIDSNFNMADFSSRGMKIEFAAPGMNIISTYPGGFASMGGTSQSAPHIAGFLALLKEKNPTMNAKELRMDLRRYVQDLGQTGFDAYYGYGMIDYLAVAENVDVEQTIPSPLGGQDIIKKEPINAPSVATPAGSSQVTVEDIIKSEAIVSKRKMQQQLATWKHAQREVLNINKAVSQIRVKNGVPDYQKVGQAIGKYNAIIAKLVEARKFSYVVNTVSEAAASLTKKNVDKEIISNFVKMNIKSSSSMQTIINDFKKQKLYTIDLVRYQNKLKKKEANRKRA